MPRARVEKVALPPGSLIAGAFPSTDYADSYRVALPASAPSEPDALVRALAASSPGWLASLLRARDRVVAPFGLKPTDHGTLIDVPPEGPLRVGDVLGMVRVHARNERELVFGADDSHLDFRVSLLRDEGGLVLSTVVHFHNVLGRAYFVPVRPAHRVIVRAMLRRLAAHLASPEGASVARGG